MNLLRSALAGILALFAATASAQQFPTVPDRTVIGRIGTGSSSGPSQAIPFATLYAQINGTQAANKVYAGPTTGVDALPTFRLLACTDISDATACNAAAGQLPATATNDSASAGKVGEFISSNVASGSAVSLTTATPANMTSISLTAGDWDVSCNTFFNLAATTSITNLILSISQTTATLDATTAGAESIYRTPAAVPAGAMNLIVGPLRISLSSTTTIFCVAQSAFTVSTNAVYGQLRARRAR